MFKYSRIYGEIYSLSIYLLMRIFTNNEFNVLDETDELRPLFVIVLDFRSVHCLLLSFYAVLVRLIALSAQSFEKPQHIWFGSAYF